MPSSISGLVSKPFCAKIWPPPPTSSFLSSICPNIIVNCYVERAISAWLPKSWFFRHTNDFMQISSRSNTGLDFITQRNNFCSCQSMNFIAKPASGTAKSSSARPTGKMPNVRIAARRSWRRNFPPSPPPAPAKQRPASPATAADITVAASVASIDFPAANHSFPVRAATQKSPASQSGCTPGCSPCRR